MMMMVSILFSFPLTHHWPFTVDQRINEAKQIFTHSGEEKRDKKWTISFHLPLSFFRLPSGALVFSPHLYHPSIVYFHWRRGEASQFALNLITGEEIIDESECLFKRFHHAVQAEAYQVWLQVNHRVNGWQSSSSSSSLSRFVFSPHITSTGQMDRCTTNSQVTIEWMIILYTRSWIHLINWVLGMAWHGQMNCDALYTSRCKVSSFLAYFFHPHPPLHWHVQQEKHIACLMYGTRHTEILCMLSVHLSLSLPFISTNSAGVVSNITVRTCFKHGKQWTWQTGFAKQPLTIVVNVDTAKHTDINLMLP